MARLFTEAKLVVASHNQGKVVEISALLAAYPVEITSSGALGLPAPEETGASFMRNAEIKARVAAGASGLPALADDSGLCVHALDGAPGIHSARWGGQSGGDQSGGDQSGGGQSGGGLEADFQMAMRRVENELSGKTDRGAHFVCALVLAWPDGHCEGFEGSVDGRLVWPPRGNLGFGYDPIFVPHGHDRTFAEMGVVAKEKISHRRQAMEKLFTACFQAPDFSAPDFSAPDFSAP